MSGSASIQKFTPTERNTDLIRHWAEYADCQLAPARAHRSCKRLNAGAVVSLCLRTRGAPATRGAGAIEHTPPGAPRAHRAALPQLASLLAFCKYAGSVAPALSKWAELPLRAAPALATLGAALGCGGRTYWGGALWRSSGGDVGEFAVDNEGVRTFPFPQFMREMDSQNAQPSHSLGTHTQRYGANSKKSWNTRSGNGAPATGVTVHAFGTRRLKFMVKSPPALL